MKIAIVSLGCPKNQVDADRYCRALMESGHETVSETSQADVVIINTCGFINSAKEEAIEQIFDACALKKENPDLVVVATGCMAERYSDELATEIPELDAVVGIGCNGNLPTILQTLAISSRKNPQVFKGDKKDLPLEGDRVISTPLHYAWLKIADGCSNACSYCAIPGIRGPLRSRRLASVLKEARWLAEQGVRELVLVAQDVTAYGDDLGENGFEDLLEALNEIEGFRWIRLLYAYPERINQRLLEVIRRSPKVLAYLDLPIQHCNEEILTSMRRRGGAKAVKEAVEWIRRELPGAVLRTSLIAGYPGETQAQFDELCAFVTETKFDRLGCFAYSPEEGTPAAKLPGQVPEEERQRRVQVIMRLQAEIMAAKQQTMIGETLEVVCDDYDDENDFWLCRSKADAPEIDVNVLVDGDAQMQPGGFYLVMVKGTDGYDLFADMIKAAE